MRIRIVSDHHPEIEGSATGRALRGFVEGLLTFGHDVEVWSWDTAPVREDLPWCHHRPVPTDARLRLRLQALVRPRSLVARLPWSFPPDAVVLADNLISFPAVAEAPRSVTQFHYLTRFDAPVLGWSPRDVQWVRAQRRAVRRARLVLAFSERVARALPRPDAVSVPIAYPVPAEPLPVVEEPTAALLADWRWPPNEKALDTLLGAWPDVRARVPGARLLLAGRHLDRMRVGTMGGVEAVGPVRYATDVLGRAAVLAFPCPPTSGPKIKVLEALAYGVPVVTSPHGVEGLVLGEDARSGTTSDERSADVLAEVLADPAKRLRMATAGRSDVKGHHAPVPSARVRLSALERLFD